VGRRQKAEGRRQKAESRKQKAAGRKQKAESRKQKAVGSGQWAVGSDWRQLAPLPLDVRKVYDPPGSFKIFRLRRRLYKWLVGNRKTRMTAQ
jgi:hypothetical protein